MALLVSGCAATTPPGPKRTAAAPVDHGYAGRVAAFDRSEDETMTWIAAADPRLATRVAVLRGAAATAEVFKRIGMEAIFSDDATAEIRGGSLDLFAFRARAKALDEAARQVATSPDALPESDSSPGALARPRLERELLGRLIEEEQARAVEEARLGDASGDLVRAIVATWTPPAGPEDWLVRDAWVSKHLLEIGDSLRQNAPRTGPPDLDVALYSLERLLAPLEFPRGSAAIAQLWVGLDQDMRKVPPLVSPERMAREAKVHLGVTLDASALPARFETTATRLRQLASATLTASGSQRPAIEARARELLLVEGSCPPVPGTRVRSMAPPSERAVICGALRGLVDDSDAAAALVALHDDVLIADAAFTTAPPSRTALLSHPDDDVVDALRRAARERPIRALGVALAADLIFGTDGADARLRSWRALGEAPLDVVAREIGKGL